MQSIKCLIAILSLSILSSQAWAHPGHSTEGSLHHNNGLILVTATIAAALFAFLVAKATIRAKNKFDIED